MQKIRPLKYQLTNLTSISERIDKNELVALDLETDGFYGTVQLAQFYQQDWEEVLIVQAPDIFALYSLVNQIHYVAHNVAYERGTLARQLSLALGSPHRIKGERCEDTFFLARLTWPELQQYSLDSCYEKLFGFDVYESLGLDKTAMQKSKWSGQLTDDQLAYAAADVFYLLELFEATERAKNSISYQLEMLATKEITALQTYGLPIDLNDVAQWKENNNLELADMNLPINVNSYRQVRPYVGSVDSDKVGLMKLKMKGSERAADVIHARSLIKQNSYLTAYQTTERAGRIQGCFNFTAVSGRGRCSEINLQQLPRAFKPLFKSEPGKVFIYSDYSQLELRMACAYTAEERMAELFRANEDLHTFTADRLGSDRHVGKTCNFNLIYGGSANMLMTILLLAENQLPIQEVRRLKKAWHNLWPSLTKWQNQQSDGHARGQLVSTLLGRQMKPKLYTDAMNLPIQGSSAEVAKLALHYQYKGFEAAGILDKVEFCNFVHDAFHWTCDDDEDLYKLVANIVGDSMLTAWQEVTQHAKIPDLPMPIEVEVGYDLTNFKYVYEV